MAQLLHGRATTTARTRQAFQQSSEPATVLARRYGVNAKTVRKWRRRQSTEDEPMGPKHRKSSVLSELEEAACVAFRVQTAFHWTTSSLH
jgi:transposase-like protein